MVLSAHACEIEVGDYVAYDVGGERRHVEALRVLRDVGYVHVMAYARTVTFRATYPVVILRGRRIV